MPTDTFRVVVRRVIAEGTEYRQGDTIPAAHLTDAVRDWLLDRGRIEAAGGTVYPCPDCDKVYDSQGWLDRHLTSKHSEEDG